MIVTPREEDPQISVPMVDILVAYPGASADEVNHLISEPLERLMSEIPGVKHVYSVSHEGLSMVTVRFEVGEQMEPSLVKLFSKLQSHMDLIPKGVLPPLVKPKSIDDVPVVTVTLSSNSLDPVQLRKLGLDVELRLKSLPNTGQSFVVGGSLQQARIEIDPSKIAAYGLTLGQVTQAINAANQHLAGRRRDRRQSLVQRLHRRVPEEHRRKSAISSSRSSENRPVYLRDIATIREGESEAKSIVDNSVRLDAGAFSTAPAVTVAVAKQQRRQRRRRRRLDPPRKSRRCRGR